MHVPKLEWPHDQFSAASPCGRRRLRQVGWPARVSGGNRPGHPARRRLLGLISRTAQGHRTGRRRAWQRIRELRHGQRAIRCYDPSLEPGIKDHHASGIWCFADNNGPHGSNCRSAPGPSAVNLSAHGGATDYPCSAEEVKESGFRAAARPGRSPAAVNSSSACWAWPSASAWRPSN